MSKYFIGQFSASPGLYLVAEVISLGSTEVEVKNVVQLFEAGDRQGLAIRPDPVFCIEKEEMDLVAQNETYLVLSAFGARRTTSNPEEPIVKQYLEKIAQIRRLRSGLITPQSKIISP